MLVSVSRSKSMDPSAHKHFQARAVETLAAFAKIMSTEIWSPIVWEMGERLRENFLSCKYAALDFDTGEWTLKDAERWCQELKVSAILGTSKSHQKAKVAKSGKVSPAVDRFRLVIPFAEVITERHAYEWNMRKLTEQVPCDGSCVDAARYFFPCKDITWSQLISGSALPVMAAPSVDHEAATKRKIERMKIAKHTGIFPSWIHAALRYGQGIGGRHRICYRLGANLLHADMDHSQIVAAIMKSPLAAIGEADVDRAVENGMNRALEELAYD